MEIQKISSNVQVQAAAVAKKPAENDAAKEKTKPPDASAITAGAVSTATKKLSAAQQAVQEATETAAQTAQEARGGDVQAQRLLAKEAANKPHAAPPSAPGMGNGIDVFS